MVAQAGDAPGGVRLAQLRGRERRSCRPRAGGRPGGILPLVAHAIAQESRITVHREEVTALDPAQITIVATGPLTSAALCAELARLTGSGQLAFYDSISPIVEADSIDMERVYFAARYDKGTADYINCPMSKEEYERFYDALIAAEAVESRPWEKLEYFEGCLPIEELARRGRETLRFGPMKPVGLRDPRTGKVPWAVVQLRCENLRADSYNLVGLQNHLKFGEQARVLRLIPGLERAKFLRYGQIHRNTYVNAPRVLTETLALRDHPLILIAGQLSGVEGYTESIATGMLAGLYLPSSPMASRRPPCPGPQRWAPWCTTLPTPGPMTSNRPISPSICCRRWKIRCAKRYVTSGSGTACSANVLSEFLTPGGSSRRSNGQQPSETPHLNASGRLRP